DSIAYSRIPCATEQGISKDVSGKTFRGTGNFHHDPLRRMGFSEVTARPEVHEPDSPSNLKPIFASLPVQSSRIRSRFPWPNCSSVSDTINDQQAVQFVEDVAEAAVLSARHGDHVEWLQHERVLSPRSPPGDLETAGGRKSSRPY